METPSSEEEAPENYHDSLLKVRREKSESSARSRVEADVRPKKLTPCNLEGTAATEPWGHCKLETAFIPEITRTRHYSPNQEADSGARSTVEAGFLPSHLLTRQCQETANQKNETSVQKKSLPSTVKCQTKPSIKLDKTSAAESTATKASSDKKSRKTQKPKSTGSQKKVVDKKKAAMKQRKPVDSKKAEGAKKPVNSKVIDPKKQTKSSKGTDKTAPVPEKIEAVKSTEASESASQVQPQGAGIQQVFAGPSELTHCNIVMGYNIYNINI